MDPSSNIDNALQEYCNFRNGIKNLIVTEPERVELNLRLLDYCLWLNLKMQDEKTIVVQVPKVVRDEIGIYGNFFYPKGVLDWPF